MPLIDAERASQDFVAPVIEAVSVMFDKMFAAGAVEHGQCPFQSGSLQNVTSIIGLAGDYVGSLCLSVPQEALFKMVQTAVDITPTTVDRLCRDSLNELTNMVAGYAKDRLIEHDIKLGLPTAVQGDGVSINYPANAEPIRIDFESDFGPLMVVFGLVRRNTGEFT